MKIKLLTGDKFSAVSLFDKDNHYGWLIYDNPSHKYRANSVYKSVLTELNTYSDKAGLELFKYYLDKDRVKNA